MSNGTTDLEMVIERKYPEALADAINYLGAACNSVKAVLEFANLTAQEQDQVRNWLVKLSLTKVAIEYFMTHESKDAKAKLLAIAVESDRLTIASNQRPS